MALQRCDHAFIKPAAGRCTSIPQSVSRHHQTHSSGSAGCLCQPAARHRRQDRRSLEASALFGTQKLGFGSNEVFVTGARGALAMRTIQQLLLAGRKVSALVPDEDEAKSVVDFAKTFKFISAKDAKNLKLVEVDPSDQDALASVLARAGTAVVIAGDSLPYASDAKTTARALAAAQEASVGKIVLVAPKGSAGGGGGFLGGLFGGRAANPEKVLADSGVPFAILRTGKPDLDAQGTALGELALGPQGSLPQQGSLSPEQIGQAAAALVAQAKEDVLVEAWAAEGQEATPVEDLLSQVLPQCSLASEGEESPAEPEPEPESAPAKPAKRGGFLAGAVPGRKAELGDPSGFAEGEERGEQKAKEQARKMRGGAFMRDSGDRAEDTRVVGSPREEAPAPRGFFGFGGGPKQVSPSAEQAQSSAARGLRASGKEAGRKAKAAARSAGGEETEKKAQGFLQRLGLGGAVDVDES